MKPIEFGHGTETKRTEKSKPTSFNPRIDLVLARNIMPELEIHSGVVPYTGIYDVISREELKK